MASAQSVLEHERMRFRTMNKKQLLTRLNKIVKLDKLRAFKVVAGELGMNDLVIEAAQRKSVLTGESFEPFGPMKDMLKETRTGGQKPKPVAKYVQQVPKQQKATMNRHLDF